MRPRDYKDLRDLPKRRQRGGGSFFAAFDQLKRDLSTFADELWSYGGYGAMPVRLPTDSLDETQRAGENEYDYEAPGGAWRIFMDLDDVGDHYELNVDLPGVKKENLDLRVEGNHLVLEGERKAKRAKAAGGAIRSERQFGEFRRRIQLPPDVDPDKVSADLNEGVLTIRLDKDEDLKKRRVEIR